MSEHHLSRRTFVGGSLAAAGAAAAAGLLPAGVAHAAGPFTIGADGISVTAGTDGAIVVSDGAGVQRLRLAHFLVKDTVLGQQRTFGGTPSAITLPDGRPAIRVDYRMGSTGVGIAVRGTFDVSARRLHARWEATSGNPMYLNSQFHRVALGQAGPETTRALTRWNRDSGGGVPYETNDGVIYARGWADTGGFIRIADSNPAWTVGDWVHVAGTYQGDVLVHDVDVVIGDLRPAAANALAQQRPLGVDIWTDQPFNLWDGAGHAMAVHAQAVNGGTTARDVELSWWGRDFDGVVVASGAETLALGAGGVAQRTVEFPSAEQGIVFVEVRVAAGGDEAFARTTLASLRPYTYQPGGRFGIANYPWLLQPSKADVAALMQRIGVASVRIAYNGAPGIAPAELEQLGIMPNIQHGDVVFGATPEQAKAWAAELVDVVVDAGAHYFEVDNERNQPWMSGQFTEEYIRDGLRPVVERLAEIGHDVKVMNNGLGGMDVNWLDNFHANGGWDLIDVFAFHPGRGNFTPDYAPRPDEWEQGSNGSYWNFLGGLREARRRLDEYGGDKELWLTEAYSCTRPNHWWNDTMRQSAENVLLTLALALSEGVDGVNWYQLHDSIIHQPQKANPTNTEYHFGLMNRDTSAKPSLLAYATATRILEGAEFVRWLEFDDGDVKGLQFDTPSGPMSILWTRTDGYFLNASHDEDVAYYPHPEAWEDDWPTKTDVAFLGARLTEVDVLGRERTVTGSRGVIGVVLDGTPRVYYGLGDQPERRVSSITHRPAEG
ncbi:hypothetical protein [Jiangella mangrovi]|uniref:Twin-arginine translocation signal domain-containing protein n=1 Tax=Jiangella mangrovi TaxID=1524084 RepID=A0A7W9LNQ6_9ACTN|nr:hypothetical protein [Jiangella mangrovi]MBB5790529.1 hypothetical protein [Jiangella mangrovi]